MGLKKYRTDAERKEARRRQSREWYYRHKDAVRVKMKKYRSRSDVRERVRKDNRQRAALPVNRTKRAAVYVENRRVLWQLKADYGCKYCGMNDPICLEFHHRDPLEKKAAVMALGSCLSRALAEAEKCDVVCANCHCYLTRRDLDGELHLPPYLKTD
jgi:hypothetical protein